jgi:hypothetical protein
MRAVPPAEADPRKRARLAVRARTRILTIVIGCLLANAAYAQGVRHPCLSSAREALLLTTQRKAIEPHTPQSRKTLE